MNELTTQELELILASNPKWAMYLAPQFALDFGRAVAEAQAKKIAEAGNENS